MAALWSAHSECPEHVKVELEARVRSFPPSCLLAPVAGEVFDNPDVCQERLQGWALSQGFRYRSNKWRCEGGYANDLNFVVYTGDTMETTLKTVFSLRNMVREMR
jgi:hypothetical protein